MRYLALILYIPAFAILIWLYWAFPRALPRTGARWRFDVAVLLLAIAATAIAVPLSVDHAVRDGNSGLIWPQVLASLAAFHIFPFVLALAWWLRQRLFTPR